MCWDSLYLPVGNRTTRQRSFKKIIEGRRVGVCRWAALSLAVFVQPAEQPVGLRGRRGEGVVAGIESPLEGWRDVKKKPELPTKVF